MCEIVLGDGAGVALVDADDYPLLARLSWSANSDGYVVAYAGGGRKARRTVYMHRLVASVKHGEEVDHRNRNRLDNRKMNLRIATSAQNKMNTASRRGSSSKYKGVSWREQNQKWVAQIQVNKKNIYLGLFDYEIDAARAYDLAARHYFGEFAWLNFPDEEGRCLEEITGQRELP